jgi:hypothetical protein
VVNIQLNIFFILLIKWEMRPTTRVSLFLRCEMRVVIAIIP